MCHFSLAARSQSARLSHCIWRVGTCNDASSLRFLEVQRLLGRSRPGRNRAAGSAALVCLRRGPPMTQKHRAALQLSCKPCSSWAGATGKMCASTYRLGDGKANTMRKYAAELVALAPDVILALSSGALAPLLEVSRTVPVVFAGVADPVAAGYVESLPRPGGNATGFTDLRIFHQREMAGVASRAKCDASGSLSRSRHRRRNWPVRRNPSCRAFADLQRSLLRRRRRSHLLRPGFPRSIPARRRLCRSHTKGREARGTSCAGADQVSTCYQPQDRQGAGHHGATNAARQRRRGDRIGDAMSASGT